MDPFLSLPSPRRWSLSQIARVTRAAADQMERLTRWLEPRTIHANERILEVPFVLSRLPRTGKILDIGCTSSPLALQLACLGYEVTAVDLRDYPFTHPRLRFEKGDILHAKIAPGSQDGAILISVLEHMGLGSYGDARGIDDDEFLRSVVRLVRPGGRVWITVPFGKAADCGWYRVYDSQRLETLLRGFTVEDKLYGRRTGLLAWELCDETALASISSDRPPMNGVALMTLIA